MSGARSSRVAAALAALAALLAPTSGAAFQLERGTVSAAVATGAGPGLRLGATLGEAGPTGESAGGGYRLSLGFWWPAARVPVAVEAVGGASVPPARTALHVPRPNPFVARSVIRYEVARPGEVDLGVYDVGGRLVRRLVDAPHDPGRYEATWDGRDTSGRRLGSAAYYVRLDVDGWRGVRKLLIVR